MTKINRLVILVLALSVTGCNTAHVTSSAPTSTPASADTVSDTNETLKGITISDYFPKDTTYTRTYHSMFGTNGKALYSTTEYTEFISSNEDSEKYIIHMSDTEISSHKASGEHAIEYTVSKNLIQRNHGILLSNEREWKNQDSVFQITGTGINMSTKAGSFLNCIEVTEQIYNEGRLSGAKKSYYAPNVGLIFSKMKADSDNYVPYEELISNINSQPVSNPVSQNISPGLHLQLIGVNQKAEAVFRKHFKSLVKAHQDLIYRRTESVKRLSEVFYQDRPDLRDAVLQYDAEKNIARFVYAYKPRADDIDTTSNPQFTIVRLASYFYITSAVDNYFESCRIELAQQGVHMEKPLAIGVFFYVNDDQYLGIYPNKPYQVELAIKNPNSTELSTVQASLPTARMTVGIYKSTGITKSNEAGQQALIRFFTNGQPNSNALPKTGSMATEQETESNENTPLINAAITGYVATIQSLIAQGDDPNKVNILSITPLMEAARNGHLQAVQILLNAQANVNAYASNGETALMWAVDGGFKDIVDLLLQHGANPDVQGEFYRTALMSAAKNGFTDIVAALLKAHADPTLQDDSEDGKNTALQYAEQAGHKDIVELLKNAMDKK
ncbi:ankyrin repeat domain-containing protein [Paenibacillus polymyxa]|uniref:ankyrin repeat domain-containing protein n=1 Tax=Paenibacillus polymyxa TaxID=1406 RepID=UPI0009C17D4E|nr:ankyrin repeat domain-containing protein [Paenibacillus polymyxa]